MYHQLQVSVPQSANDGVPEVLERFQIAAMSTGRLDKPTSDGVMRWCSRGRLDGEMTLGLLWPYLGEVKRAQAARALTLVDSQYDKGRLRRRPPRYLPTLTPHPGSAVIAPGDNVIERAWAAGFLDAEGSFGLVHGVKRKRGPDWYRIRVSASQHSTTGREPDVLLRLRAILGVGRIERHGEPDDYKWVVEGRRGVMRVIELTETWLGSVKLAQAEDALGRFDRQERFKGGSSSTCLRGHTYDRIVVTASGKIRKYCTACARICERAGRASHGAKSRHVRSQPEDPSRTYRAM